MSAASHMTITTLFQQQCLHLPSERIRLAIILPGTLPKQHVALGRLKHLSKGQGKTDREKVRKWHVADLFSAWRSGASNKKMPAHASMQKQTETGDSYCTQGSKKIFKDVLAFEVLYCVLLMYSPRSGCILRVCL